MLSLYKLILDYKVSLNRRDELMASDHIKDISERLVSGLINLDLEAKNLNSRGLWLDLLTITDIQHPVSEVVIEYVSRHINFWKNASEQERTAYVRSLFSPYLPSPALLTHVLETDFPT